MLNKDLTKLLFKGGRLGGRVVEKVYRHGKDAIRKIELVAVSAIGICSGE